MAENKTTITTHEKIVTGTQAAATAVPKTSGGKPSAAGHAASGAAKGAATGAAIGSVVPVVGTVAGAAGGAVVGGAAGGISGKRKAKQWKVDQKAAKRAALGPGRQIVVMEFVICMVILALSPLTDKHKTEGPQAFMRRGSAVCALFLILALLSAGGPKAGRVAAGFGGLVTLTLLVSSRDVFAVLAKKFNSSKDGPAGPDDGEVGEAVGEAAGQAAGDLVSILNRLNPPAEAGPLGNGIR